MTQICKQRRDAQFGVPFPSASNPDKVYHAYIYREEEPDFCNCWPAMTGRKKRAKELGVDGNTLDCDCKHVRTARAETCSWNGEGETECPKCHGPIVYTEDFITPSIEDIVAFRKQLMSEQAEVDAIANLPKSRSQVSVDDLLDAFKASKA